MFLRATCERPALLFIDRFDTVGEHPLVTEVVFLKTLCICCVFLSAILNDVLLILWQLCLELDNLDRQVHVCVAVRLVLITWLVTAIGIVCRESCI
jgi:hypothetical protein